MTTTATAMAASIEIGMNPAPLWTVMVGWANVDVSSDTSAASASHDQDTAAELTPVREVDNRQVGEGKRSLAFALRLRAADRTLTASETAAVRDAVVAEANRRFGATLRG